MRSTESCCNNICCKQVVVCSINSGNSLSTSSMNTRVHTTLNYKSTSAQINFTSHRRQRRILRPQHPHLIHRTQIQAILFFYFLFDTFLPEQYFTVVVSCVLISAYICCFQYTRVCQLRIQKNLDVYNCMDLFIYQVLKKIILYVCKHFSV